MPTPADPAMRLPVLAAAFVVLLCPAAPAAEVDYVRDIKPILTARCSACHGAVRQKAGLRLDAGQLVRKGGKKGPVVVPGEVPGEVPGVVVPGAGLSGFGLSGPGVAGGVVPPGAGFAGSGLAGSGLAGAAGGFLALPGFLRFWSQLRT